VASCFSRHEQPSACRWPPVFSWALQICRSDWSTARILYQCSREISFSGKGLVPLPVVNTHRSVAAMLEALLRVASKDREDGRPLPWRDKPSRSRPPLLMDPEKSHRDRFWPILAISAAGDVLRVHG
jgi:hypothetical protein